MSEEPKDGGPAFPCSVGLTAYADGMTLRDWFAGQALAGELAAWQSSTEGHEYSIANRAYGFADAMLAAREARNG